MVIEVNYRNKKRYKTARYPLHQTPFWTWLIWILSKFALIGKEFKVETINIRSMGVFSAESNRMNSADVYQQKNANEYYLSVDGKYTKITTKKHVLKLYPEHKAEIEAFMDKNKIQMNEPLSVLELLNFCMALE